MSNPDLTSPLPKAMVWTGRAISAIPIAMMLFGTIFFSLFKIDMVRQGMIDHGYAVNDTAGILILEMSCTLIYLIPQTAVLGAILMTGYLGGAVATHVRVGENFAGPVVFGVLVWLGLLIRDRRLQFLLPLRRLMPPSTPAVSLGTENVDPIE